MRACRLFVLFVFVAVAFAQYDTTSKTCTNTETSGGCQNCNAPITWVIWNPLTGQWINRLTGQQQDTTLIVRIAFIYEILIISLNKITMLSLFFYIRTLEDSRTQQRLRSSATARATRKTASTKSLLCCRPVRSWNFLLIVSSRLRWPRVVRATSMPDMEIILAPGLACRYPFLQTLFIT